MKRFLRTFSIGALVLLLSAAAWAAQTIAQTQAGDPRILQFGVKYGF